MTIKNQGGIFGRNPTFNNVTVEGDLTVNGEPISDFGTMAQQDADAVNIDGGSIDGTPIGVNTAQRIRGRALFSAYTPDGLYGATALPSAVHTPSFAEVIFGYQDDGSGQYNPRIGFQNSASATPNKNSIGNRSDGAFTINVGNANQQMFVFTAAGNLGLINGGGIDFSATSGTGTSELFDDYEEGTWTPASSTITLSTATGSYTKIGRVVTYFAEVIFPATADGNLAFLTGLPFAPANDTDSRGGGNIGFTDYTASTLFVLSQTLSRVYFSDPAGLLTNANLSGKTIQFGGTYYVS